MHFPLQLQFSLGQNKGANVSSKLVADPSSFPEALLQKFHPSLNDMYQKGGGGAIHRRLDLLIEC